MGFSSQCAYVERESKSKPLSLLIFSFGLFVAIISNKDQDQLKHVCKFCYKSFPCGRSLGGHMRSHVMNSSSAETDGNFIKKNKKRLLSVNNGGNHASPEMGTEGGTYAAAYGLRENPKKTCRFADSNEDTFLLDKLCKGCGKGFQSWKALFGHMKCHSVERFSNSNVEEEDSWTIANHQKPVFDSQSDNDTAAPNRKKRSSRRRTLIRRYMPTNSSFFIANNNNNNNNNNNGSTSSLSEIEHEQEEVAMCLMMLSKDVGNKGSGLNSVAESSDNNFDLLEVRKSKDNSWSDGGETPKFKKMRNGKMESYHLASENSQLDTKQLSEHGASRFSRDGSKLKRSDDSYEVELGKNLVKKKGLNQADQFSSEKQFNSELVCGPDWDTEKKSKFECATCNKIFHSYQALGGHRASHRKIKGCSFGSENSIETEISPDPTSDSNYLSRSSNNEDPTEQEVVLAHTCGSKKKKKNKGHECPICFKVFSSGQALGGHKRTHLNTAGSEAKSNQTVVNHKPISEIKDLDLNLPAPVEEESGGQVGFKPWWVSSNHNSVLLLALLSN